MDKETAERIVEGCKEGWRGGYVGFQGGEVCLDGYFTADQLEAVLWLMRNGVEKKRVSPSPSSAPAPSRNF